jgi:hypothetical protein
MRDSNAFKSRHPRESGKNVFTANAGHRWIPARPALRLLKSTSRGDGVKQVPSGLASLPDKFSGFGFAST